jgi:RsiW-degrading membrane proteinase PrsW (M82 family)
MAHPATAPQLSNVLRILAAVGGGMIFLCMAACTALILLISIPDPIALFFSIWAAIIPAVFYSLLVLYLDRYESEPWYLLVGAFMWGAVVSVFLSLIFELTTGGLVIVVWGEDAANFVSGSIAAPISEEMTKAAALFIILLLFRSEFDGILDGIVYGALVGLGFAMTENILYFGATWVDEGPVAFGVVFFLRAIMGGFGHALYTAITGAAIGWATERPNWRIRKVLVPLGGLCIAIFMHSVWNTLVFVLSTLDEEAATIAAAILLLIIEPFVFTLPALIGVIIVATIAGRHELQIIGRELQDEIPTGLLTVGELAMLSNRRLRRRASWQSFWNGGPVRWYRLRQFSQAASELAFQKYQARLGRKRRRGLRQRSDADLRADIVSARYRLAQTY